MATGYYLLDNPVSGPTKWYPSRRSPVQGVVVHCTASIEDLDGAPDHSAEATARYCANTDRAVSWHAGCDTDSVIRLLPSSYTAFHCRDNNSNTLGLEISKRHTDWRTMDPTWIRATLTNAAVAVRPWVAEYRIPARKVTRYEWDAGARGFIGHWELDPSRRSDPGLVRGTDTFPWATFLARVLQEDDMPLTTDEREVLDTALAESTAAKNYAIAAFERLGGDEGDLLAVLAAKIDRLAHGAIDMEALAAAVADNLAARLRD